MQKSEFRHLPLSGEKNDIAVMLQTDALKTPFLCEIGAYVIFDPEKRHQIRTKPTAKPYTLISALAGQTCGGKDGLSATNTIPSACL